MKQKEYLVKFTHVIEREITGMVIADNEDDAIAKAKEWEFEDSDEESAPEQEIECKGHRIVEDW